jgi:AcrR family transcriptional regulator
MSAPSGRPRDPNVDLRVTKAAVQLFGEVGWSGVSIDAVARASGVSKRSIYLRWSNRDALLSEALAEHVRLPAHPDTGNIRDDLVFLATRLIEFYTGPSGGAALRLAFEPGDDLGGSVREYLRASQIDSARQVVHRAIERGELDSETSITLLLDTVCGAALNHVIGTPPRRRREIGRDAAEYAAGMVDFVMAQSPIL